MKATPGVDVHAHFFPERFLALIEEAGGASGGRVDRSNPRGPALMIGAGRTAPLEPRFYDIDRRLASMDRQGVGVQALSLTVPMVWATRRSPSTPSARVTCGRGWAWRPRRCGAARAP